MRSTRTCPFFALAKEKFFEIIDKIFKKGYNKDTLNRENFL